MSVAVQVNIPRDTGLPEDVSTNTWHFRVVPPANSLGAGGSAIEQLKEFYTDIGPYLSSVNGSPWRFKAYDYDDPEPRVPILDELWATPPAGVSPLPEEVAICLNFQGVPVSGENQNRRRGRVFLGPLGNSAGELVAGRYRVDDAVTAAIATAAESFRQAMIAEGFGRWAVFSPTQFAVDGFGLTDVDEGWVDDAFDTIRSRGPAPLARSTFP